MSDPATPEPTPNNPPAPEAAPPADASAAPTDSRPEYEFSEAQNEVLNSLTNGILWVRLPLFIVGLFQAVIAVGWAFRLHRDGAHIIGIMGHGLAAIVCFLLANWLLKAAVAFTRVTTTTGRDMTNLMTGIRDLALWFDALAFFVKLYLALLSVLMIILLVGLFAGAFRGPG
jgi:hypothetical protein